MTGDFALTTERLVLRGWRDADLEPLLAICTDPRVMAHLGPLQTRAEVAGAIDRMREFQAAQGCCFWAVERQTDSALLGFCGLKPGPQGTPIAGRTEIGWRLRADAWGQGYAREAAQASLGWGWANLPDAAIWAITVPGNSASRGLMARLGLMRHEDLDFEHPDIPEGSPLRHCITYSIGRET